MLPQTIKKEEVKDDLLPESENKVENITIKDVRKGYTIWIDKKNITRFLENVWIDAIVQKEDVIPTGTDYTYNYNWDDNLIRANILDKNRDVKSKIQYDISIYNYTYHIMKEEFINMVRHRELPNYVWNNLSHKTKKYLSQIIKTRDRIGIWFTYYDNTDEKEFYKLYDCPDYWNWYRYPGINYEPLMENFSYGNRRDCLQLLFSTIKKRLVEQNKNEELKAFEALFPSEQVFKIICSLNKAELKFKLEGVYFDE